MANALKAGTFSDLADSMAGAIEDAMAEEWMAAHGTPMMAGGPGEMDRRVLFAAVAKGVLRYLYLHRADLVTGIAADTPIGHAHALGFDLQEKA